MQGQTTQGNFQRRGIREPSYEVKPEWPKVMDFGKQRFDKLPNLTPGIHGCEAEAGQIPLFNAQWEKVTTRKAKKLPKYTGHVPDCDIISDPHIQELALSKKANVFISDVVAAALMCSSKANYSWDLIINNTGGIIFIDKREEENMLDMQTVSETAQPDWHPLDEEGKNGVR